MNSLNQESSASKADSDSNNIPQSGSQNNSQPDLQSAADTGFQHTSKSAADNGFLPASKSEAANGFRPAFSRIYIEKEALSYPLTDTVKSRYPDACVIPVTHYKDVFNRKHQDFYLQKQSPALILAVKKGTLIYPGAPVCQNFGSSHFYYTSSIMNCIYDCEYCYLQGMYPSANLVLFVNLHDIFEELNRLLAIHPVYLCISYDTDLLALEGLTGYVHRWISYTQTRSDLQIEIRTKSASYSLISELKPSDNVILAWTLSPERVAAACEHRVPSLRSRLRSARLAAEDGWPVRLCFDPLVMTPDAVRIYREFIGQVFEEIPASSVRDISIGTFRISAEYLKQIRKSRPACAVLSYPFEICEGVASYQMNAGKVLIDSVRDIVRTYVDENRIFLYQMNDGE